MSAQYSRDHCKIAVVKILQTIGWHGINSTPLEVLTDLLVQYFKQISKITNDYATEFGNTEANLDNLGLAFQEMGINLADLDEYVTYVNFCPPAHSAPKFPIPKEDNLNFLKPGSQEVVTRPVHIHEHMPPMFPLLEESETKPDERDIKEEPVDEQSTPNTPQFKKPADISPEFRRTKRDDEGGRPTREISSVMMTTSGFLSPAREGKLPEAKAPLPPAPVEPPPPPPPPPPVPAPPIHLNPGPLPNDTPTKKKSEKREKKINKELFKPISEEKIVKKNASMKDVVKMKHKVAAAAAAAANPPIINPPNLVPSVPLSFLQPPRLSEIKVSPVPPQKLLRDTPDKALAAAKAKTEKFNTTITPIPLKSNPSMGPMGLQVEKLFNEPDRKKINILRKISNVKDNKSKKESRANTPNLLIDEGTDIVNKISLSSDITIEPIPMRKSPMFFDDGSPPTTPSTPRTPEIILHHQMPPIHKEKRRRKDPKPKIKKPRKTQHRPLFTESELMDIIVNRPKTPEPHVNHMRSQLPPHMGLPPMPFPFLANFGGPGLIPSQLTTPMFPFSHLGGIPNFGKNPYFPSTVPNLSPQMDVTPAIPIKTKEPKEVKEPKEIKEPKEVIKEAPPVEIKPPPVDIIPQPQPAPPPPPVQQQPIQVPETSSSTSIVPPKTPTPEIIPKKSKEHKKEKKDKIKKKNKKDKVKEKGEKKKLKEPKKEGKEKIKREKKIKKKEKLEKGKEKIEILENPIIPKILLKVNSPSPRPETPERKLNIKPITKKDEIIHEKKRESSPCGLAKISALVTGPPKPKNTLSPVPPIEKHVVDEPPQAPTPRTPGRPRLHPLKPKPPPKPKKIEQQAFKKIDEQGNEVWICPSCGQQDDGRPMIGCDGCDAWYHWVCVGIQVPPDENENWYCKPCLARKNEDFQSDKKRKRKRKEKKEH